MKLVNQQNYAQIARLTALIDYGSPIAIDCETTGLRAYGGDTLRGFSFAYEDNGGDLQSYYVPVGYGSSDDLPEKALQVVCRAIADVDPLYVYHHSKFDLRFLRQLPRDIDGSAFFPVPRPGKLWDTKVVAWLLDENMGTSLDAQAQFHFGTTKSEYMKQLLVEKGTAALREEGRKGRIPVSEARERGWALITAHETAEYGAMDAELTLRLHYRQMELIGDNHPTVHGNPARAVEREHRVQGLLLRMEDNGILIDEGHLADILDKKRLRLAEIEQLFLEWYGTNLNSPAQVSDLLFVTLGLKVPQSGRAIERDEFPGADRKNLGVVKLKSRPSVSRAVLEGLKSDKRHGERVEMILEHRRLAKAISSYLEPISEKVDAGGRLHPTFWSMGTVTGRFSCSDPNLQTIPRGDTLVGVRDVFVAEWGFELWEYDLQAAEMRVVAGMANEQVLIDGLNAGTDMHGLLASQVFGETFTGIQRRYAKNIGYGFFYGLSSPATAAKYIEGMDGQKTAVKILTGLKALYPNVVKLMRISEREAEKHGYIRIHANAWPGRFRRFITESPRKPYPYTALNAKVQGGIGEFVKDVMLETEPQLNAVGARLCLQIHDELVLEVPAGMGPKVGEILQDAANKLNPFAMPMIFEGKPWGEHE